MGFSEVNEYLLSWRQKVIKLTREDKAQTLALRCVRQIDRAVFNEKELPNNPLAKAYREMEDAADKIKKTKQRDPSNDFEFELSFFVFEGLFYGIVYCERSAWRKKFLNHVRGWTTDYSYWNNTDRPDRMSLREWNERERVWCGIFPRGASSAVERGFSVDCTAQPHHRVKRADVMRHIPDLRSRASNLAKDLVMTEAMVKNEFDPYGDLPTFEYMKAMDFLRSDEGREKVEHETVRIMAMLPEIEPMMLSPMKG